MNIAIHNIHLAPNILDLGIHNYIVELVNSRYITHLYFTENNPIKILSYLRTYWIQNNFKVSLSSIKIIFTPQQLRSDCDVLINFNTYTKDHDFTESIRKFNGIKIWHVGDYFWNEPGSIINKRFEDYGVDYLLGYSSHDKHCSYFQKTFPKYLNKVIPVPFGFSGRFKSTTKFDNRENKCVGVGSVNPLRPLEYPVQNFVETANFYPDQSWFHPFRRKLVLNSEILPNFFESKFPVFPRIKDFSYDLVATFNQYKLFVSCESIFKFPPAKSFEGPACGAVMVCSNEDCYKEFGFKDGENCIMFETGNLEDFTERVRYYTSNPESLLFIQKNSIKFVRNNFTHKKIAKSLGKLITSL